MGASASGMGGGVPMAPQGNFNVNRAAAGGLQQAMQGTQQSMGFRPQNISAAQYRPSQAGFANYSASNIAGAAPISAQNVTAGQVAGANLSAYQNPFETQVINQSLADIERNRLMQQNQIGAQASASRAFGGSRQGIAEAETNRAFADQAARMASGLRQSGFQNAQQLAGRDAAARTQAALANQQSGLMAQQSTAANTLAAQRANQAAQNQAGQFGASAANQAALANQAAQNQAGQFNVSQIMNAQQLNQAAGLQGNQQRLGAAGQMGQLGQQAFNTSQAIQDQQMRQGMMQQAMQQQIIDAARQQYQGYSSAPQAALSAPLAALGVAPTPQTQTTSNKPGLFDYLGAGLGMFGV